VVSDIRIPSSVWCIEGVLGHEFIFLHIFRRGDKTPANAICFYDLAESCRQKYPAYMIWLVYLKKLCGMFCRVLKKDYKKSVAFGAMM
jgi:hypothetical protein